MSEAKHTPGPWRAEDIGGTFIVIGRPTWECTRFDAPGEWDVATVDDLLGDHQEEASANASLIAAAPDLLEALKWMVENDDTNEGDEPMDEYSGHSWNELNSYWLEGLNRARAAIAKAEGVAP